MAGVIGPPRRVRGAAVIEPLPTDTTCILGYGRAGQAMARALTARRLCWVALDRGGEPTVAPWLAADRPASRPPVRRAEVVGIQPDPGGFGLEGADGSRLSVRRLIVATGCRASWRSPPDLPDGARDLGDPALVPPEPGQQVLVVGTGALPLRAALRLWERGVRVALSLPGPALLLDPALAPSRPLGRLLPHLPPAVAGWLLRRGVRDLRPWDWPLPFPDVLSGHFISDAASDITCLTLREAAFDAGLGQLVRQGALVIYPPVARLALPRVVFADGREDRFDVCLVAPTAASGLTAWLSPGLVATHLGPDGLPHASGILRDGLGFIGFGPAPLASQAASLADALAR